jgi:PAS domain S-box-containing protein
MRRRTRLPNTPQRKIEELQLRLAKAESRYSEMVEHAVDGMFRSTPQGRYLSVNPAMARMFGYDSPQEFLAVITDIEHQLYVVPERRQEIKRRMAKHGFVEQFEYECYCKDGSRIWVGTSARAVRNARGGILYYEGINRDVTGRKRAELAQAAFAGLGQRLNAARSRVEAARIILDVADELLGWDACFLHLCSPTGKKILHVLNIDLVNGRRQELPGVALDGRFSSLVRQVICKGGKRVAGRHRRGVLKGLLPFGDTSRRSESLLFVPIRHGVLVTGILSIQSYTPGAFDEPDLRLLQAMADHCGAALERIRAEEALRESEQRFYAFMDAPLVAAWMKDEQFRYVYVNEAWAKVSGRGLGLVQGKTDFDIWTNAVARQFRANDEMVLASGKMLETFESARTADGQPYHGWIFKFPFTDSSGRRYIGGMGIEITERVRLEQQMTEISQREQRRIGQDLHDGLGQLLTGVALQSKLLAKQLDGESTGAGERAARITKLVNQAIEQTRNMAHLLNPVLQEARGLMAALGGLAVSIHKQLEMDCRFRCPRPVLIHDGSVAEHVYRIAQEAVNNALKHAHARRIVIRLSVSKSSARLTVKDDGRGLSLSHHHHHGMGLHLMRHRAQTIGGSLEVRREGRGGTCVDCVFPLHSVKH